MNEQRTSRGRAVVRSFALVVAGVAAAWVLSKPLGRVLQGQIDPHAWLVSHRGDRLYVATGCGYSQQAVDYVASAALERRFVVVPVDRAPGPERDERCAEVLALLDGEDGPWWSWLPDSYLCDRLFASAFDWGFEHFDGRIPGFVVDGAPLEPGFDEAQRARLQR